MGLLLFRFALFFLGTAIMPNEVLVRDEDTRVLEVEEIKEASQNPHEALCRVVDAVRHDSQQESVVFLAETTVPHGGE